MRFSAPYDATAKIVSLSCIVLLVMIAAGTRSLIAAAVTLIILVLACCFSPLGYAVSDGCIIVRRMLGSVRIPLSGIRTLRPATPEDFRGCIRLFGSGGLFGYFGTFRTSALGKCTWYMTDRSKAVIAASDSKTVLFSPGDVDGFLAAIRAVQPSAQSAASVQPSFFTAVEPSRGFPGAAVAVITGIALAIAAAAMFYSPGPPSVAIAGANVTIHDRFHTVTLSADQIDLPNIRVIDLGSDTGWRPTLKLGGFSNFYYRSGLFRAANGQSVDFFAARTARLVLLPPKGSGTPVLVESPDPEALVAELAKAGR